MPSVLEVRTKDFVVTIEHDVDAESPREWGSALGTMICWHRTYCLGDKHDFQTPSDFIEEVSENEHLILPLYLYDHSGITMSTSPFGCQWDSGQVGWYYVSYSDIQKEYGELTDETIEKAKQLMIAEVEEYDTYLRGEVYGYIIERKVYNDDTNEIETEDARSCWGFYGSHDKSGIIQEIADFDSVLGSLVAEKLGVTIEVA